MENRDYLIEKDRLSTFKSWKFASRHSCSAKKMAEAGFYFIGSRKEPDLVRCFLCGKELDGWEKDDDPWDEHLSHSPSCNFAKLKTPEDGITVKQFLTLCQNLNDQCVQNYFDSLLDKLEKSKHLTLTD